MSTEDTKKAREERARKLHQQISEIKEGKSSDLPPVKNPRDFIAKRMREIIEEKKQESLNENLEEDQHEKSKGC